MGLGDSPPPCSSFHPQTTPIPASVSAVHSRSQGEGIISVCTRSRKVQRRSPGQDESGRFSGGRQRKRLIVKMTGRTRTGTVIPYTVFVSYISTVNVVLKRYNFPS